MSSRVPRDGACAGLSFHRRGEHWLRFLELHVDYYTRGYHDPGREDRRVFYGALGLNVGEVVAVIWGRTRFFDYYQVPWTYLPVPHHPGD